MRSSLQRPHLVTRIRARLEHDGFPRLQMFLLVSLTGAAGFLASFILLHSGMSHMGLRYFLAFGCAYIAFLGLLWLWLRTRAEDYGDLPDLSSFSSSGNGHCDASHFSGGGGSGGGGGASGSFDIDPVGASSDAASHSTSKALDSVAEVMGGANELALPLVIVVAMVAFVAILILSSLWIVYGAPVLFAELLVDSLLAAGLYRRLRGLDSQHWIMTAMKRTAWPFVLTALSVSLIGWGMQKYAPEAHSLAEVVAYAKSK